MCTGTHLLDDHPGNIGQNFSALGNVAVSHMGCMAAGAVAMRDSWCDAMR